jgi:hypothetical protein
MTKVLRRSRWLARLAATLTVGVAGLVVAASVPARAGIVFQSTVAASWGDNREGDLGNGTTDIRPQYGDIRFANEVVQVAAGYYFGLALRSDGTVWAWGDNGSGQLGDSTTTDRSTPVSPPGCGPARSWAPTARSGAGAITAPGNWSERPPPRR